MTTFGNFVPTESDDIDCFFKLAPVSTSDLVYDLGSGDGRLLFAAVQRGAGSGVGVELDHELVLRAREKVWATGAEGKVYFVEGNVLDADITDASVIFCYLFPEATIALKPKFEGELKKGTRVVMEGFQIPTWTPTKVMQSATGRSFYLYIIQ